jgi:SAM-dependent methyltransferase
VSRRGFLEALKAVPERDRDGWLNQVFGLEALPQDSPALPRGCVPYLPSSVNTLLRMIELAEMRPDDVFVDIGSGLGRATALTHLLTGAGAIGLEIQPELVRGSRELASRLNTERVVVVEGDAVKLTGSIAIGSVFFLYCPFSGERLDRVIDDLELIAQTRTIHVCSVDLPLPARGWLTPVSVSGELAVYRSCR